MATKTMREKRLVNHRLLIIVWLTTKANQSHLGKSHGAKICKILKFTKNMFFKLIQIKLDVFFVDRNLLFFWKLNGEIIGKYDKRMFEITQLQIDTRQSRKNFWQQTIEDPAVESLRSFLH